MKVELASVILLLFSLSLATFLIKLTNKNGQEESDEIAWVENEIRELTLGWKIEYRNLTIEIEEKLFDGIISTVRLTFQEALGFCEENDKRMPADYFKIKSSKFEDIDDLQVWVNASMDVTRNVSSGSLKMRQKLDQIRSEIFDEPLWVVQNYGYYFLNGELIYKRKNALFYTLPGKQDWDFIRFICDNDIIDDEKGIVKVQTRESAENLPCKPLILTKTFLETHFNEDGYIEKGFYSGLKLKDYDFHLTNLSVITAGEFAFSWMACDSKELGMGEDCNYLFSDGKFGKLRIVEQSIYHKVICY